MFILESNGVKSAMFATGLKADIDIDLCHKRIGHINLQKLKGIKSKGVVIGLPTFTEKEINGVCGACQFSKQHQHHFRKERNLRTNIDGHIWRMSVLCYLRR